jgi:hypothetical protein
VALAARGDRVALPEDVRQRRRGAGLIGAAHLRSQAQREARSQNREPAGALPFLRYDRALLLRAVAAPTTTGKGGRRTQSKLRPAGSRRRGFLPAEHASSAVALNEGTPMSRFLQPRRCLGRLDTQFIGVHQ